MGIIKKFTNLVNGINVYLSKFDNLGEFLKVNIPELVHMIALVISTFGFYLIIAGFKEKGTKLVSLSFLSYVLIKVVIESVL